MESEDSRRRWTKYELKVARKVMEGTSLERSSKIATGLGKLPQKDRVNHSPLYQGDSSTWTIVPANKSCKKGGRDSQGQRRGNTIY